MLNRFGITIALFDKGIFRPSLMENKVLTNLGMAWLLAAVLLTVGACLNLYQRAFHHLPPTDGVLWVQREDGIYADKVLPNYAGSRAGIARGDKLLSIVTADKEEDAVTSVGDIAQYLEATGAGGSISYYFQRTSYSFADNYYYADLRNLDTLPRWTPSILFVLAVGLVWLSIGLFVLLKQGSRVPYVLHFATVCLVAFVFMAYRPLGLGEDMDLAISLFDEAAYLFFAPVFLHFCIRYPVRSEILIGDRLRTYALYMPAALLWAISLIFNLIPQIFRDSSVSIALSAFADSFNLFNLFNTIFTAHFLIFVGTGAGFLIWRFICNKQIVVRQRLKWAVVGTIVAFVPTLTFQLTRNYFQITDDTFSSALTILPLALIPISFGHSVVRYRLMDVDIVVRRLLVYAITTAAIAVMIGAVALILLHLALGDNLETAEKTLRIVVAIIAMAVIVLLSEPLKNFLQTRADRFFYGERYDMRRSLLDFGRTLSATTALDDLLEALANRLQQVMNVEKVAVFVEDISSDTSYTLAKSIGLNSEFAIPPDFRTMIRQKSADKGVVRADELESVETETTTQGVFRHELHYFVPCVTRGRMVSVIGLGRSRDGSLLSSEDLEILRTVSGYVAVAIENSLLYEEQHKRNEELALLKEFNESIVESVNVGLIAVDENGIIRRCNSTFETLIGLSRKQIENSKISEIFDPHFAAGLERTLGKSHWYLTEVLNAYKQKMVDSQGDEHILNVAIAPLRTETVDQNGAIIVLEDVTTRVRFESSLQQNEKLSSIGLLAAGVAHEVNTPLTGVSSYTQMLLGMIPESDPKHLLLQKMHRQTERATNIVSNLLNFSRTGNSTDFYEIDVNRLLDDTLQLLEPQMRSAQVTVTREYSDIPPRIMGNPGKLQQVFTNLIMNARDAINSSGKIRLETISNGRNIIVSVTDDGDGISPENIGKIFDPFFTTKEVGSGTGLGLAVVYGIVQEHEGRIEAVSEVEKGTTFKLTFPVAQKFNKRAVS